MKKKIIAAQIALCLTATAQNSAVKLWKELPGYQNKSDKTKKIEFKNSGFESGKKNWIIQSEYKIVPGEGRNSTTALVCERKDPKKYTLARRVLKLKQNRSYKIGCWVKADIKKQGRHRVGASFYLQFKKDGKTLSYVYQPGLIKSGDWTYLERSFSMPPNADTCILCLCLHRGFLGKVWFDNLSLVALDNCLIYVTSPGSRTLFTDSPRMKIAACRTGGILKGKLYCLVKAQAKNYQAELAGKLVNGQTEVTFKNLKPGKLNVDLLLVDVMKKQILATEKFTMNVLSPQQRNKKNACWIDLRGRAIINGKPFLPIGLYKGHCSKKDVDIIADSDFNCLMPYGSLWLRLYPKLDREKSIEKVKEVLDYCHSKKFKIIFSLQNIFDENVKYAVREWHGTKGADNIVKRAVLTFKDHPAVMAWYVNDERPSSMFKALYARRKQINLLDPYHPTWCVSMHFSELYNFAQTCDIMGIDPYPLKKQARNMYLVEFAGEQAQKTKMPLWCVPQIYNMAYCANKNDVKKIETWTKVHRDPSETEIRSMSLSMALNGAKGFIFYHYNCLKDEYNKIPIKNYFAKNWPKVKNVASTLKSIAPFLLSDNDQQKVSLAKRNGKVKAGEFINNQQKSCIIIVSEGPGASSCIINSDKNLKSKFGYTRKISQGKYQYHGQDICSDILIEE